LQPIKYSLNISILYRGVSPSPLWPFIFIVTAFTSFRLTTFLKSGAYRVIFFTNFFNMNLRIFPPIFFSWKREQFFCWSKKAYFLSFEHWRKSKQILHCIKFRRFVFEKFVKTCCELDLWFRLGSSTCSSPTGPARHLFVFVSPFHADWTGQSLLLRLLRKVFVW
jgi:hypothetical protein